MHPANILDFGIFDTDAMLPGQKKTNGRLVTFYEAEFFLSCTGRATVDDAEYPLSPGAVLLARPGQYRRSLLGFQCYYLHFSLPPDSPYAARLAACPDYYRLIDSDAYRSVFEGLVRHLSARAENGASEYTAARMTELFYYFGEDAARNRNYTALQSKSGHGADFIPPMLAYLRENCAAHITLEELAARFHYSAHYVQSAFRRVVGMTPQAYLTQLRIERAKILLSEGEMSLSDIAVVCGFSSQSHFTATFRRLCGNTPYVWRRARRTALLSLYGKTT